LGAPLPQDEQERLQALHRYAVLDTPPEKQFDRITRLLAASLDVPMAAISLVAEDRQWFKSRVGLSVAGTPRDVAFCAHTILSDSPLVVEDASLDGRFAASPLVAGPRGIRFYAGAPIVSRDGRRVGALCAMDRRPRRIGARAVALLGDLAAIVADELELRVAADRFRFSETWTRAMLDALPFDIWATDAEGRCILQNATDRLRLGDAHGRKPAELAVDPQLGRAWDEGIARVLQGETLRSAWVDHSTGSDVELEVTVVPLRIAGEIVGSVGLSVDVTARSETERRLRASEQRLHDFLAAATEWLWETDATHRIRFISENAGQAMPAHGALGMTRWEVAGDAPETPAWRAHRERLAVRMPFRDFSYSLLTADGRRRHCEISGVPVIGEDGTFLGYRGSGRDVTERKVAEDALRIAHQRLHALMNAGIIGVLIGIDDRITEANQAVLNMLGLDPGDLAGDGLDWTRLTPPEWLELERRLQCEAGADAPRPYEKEYFHKSGRRIPVLITPAFVDRATGHWIILVQDMTQRKQDEARIRELAYSDPLTGLPNRRAFHEELSALTAVGGDALPGSALLLVDLDNFKHINDSLGHDAGDEVLRQTAGRLRSAVRQTDLVARLGGDEFAIILRDPGHRMSPGRIASQVIERLARPLSCSGCELRVSASIGLARLPGDGRSPAQLLKHADLALYRAKAQGRRSWRQLRDREGPAGPGDASDDRRASARLGRRSPGPRRSAHPAN
jgi:diguanylate cyclase (GGDEF)-like protein/PAS domain S-box-containing protein